MIFAEVFVIALLVAISPGPDFLVVTRNALESGRRAGVASGLGVASALTIHAAYSILGLTILVQMFPMVFTIVQVAGAGFLVWLAVTALLGTLKKAAPDAETSPLQHPTTVKSQGKAFREGFFCNMLNPKAYIFFLSIFSQFLAPGMPSWVEAVLAFEVIFTAGAWFTLLSVLIARPYFRSKYYRFRKVIERTFGGILILLALKIVHEAFTGSRS